MNTIQKKIFLEKEADAWFKRNLSAIEKFSTDQDVVYPLMKRYNMQPERILEIGCSAGHRLSLLKRQFPNSSVRGIDPSREAVEYGKRRFALTDNEIFHGTADLLDQFEEASFDLIIVGFVFYVVDRELLFAAIHQIDRLLRNKGNLITIDFFAVSPKRNPYHHIREVDMFSYKQRYEDLFVGSHAYHMIAKDSFSCDTNQYSNDDHFDNNYCAILLKKDNTQAYV